MTTENPNEGNQAAAGATQPPVAPPSQAQGQLSQDQIKAIMDGQIRLEQQIKGLQKGTDKQIGQVRSEVKRILELKEQGMDEVQIQRELAVDRLLEQGSVIQPLVGNETRTQSLDVDVKSLGLSETDPNVAILRTKYSGADLLKELAALKTVYATIPPASAATAIPPQGGQAQQTEVKMTEEQYTQEQMAIVNSTRPGDERIQKLADLKKKASERGLDKY